MRSEVDVRLVSDVIFEYELTSTSDVEFVVVDGLVDVSLMQGGGWKLVKVLKAPSSSSSASSVSA